MRRIIPLFLAMVMPLLAYDFGKLLEDADKSWQTVQDMSAIFHTRELVGDQILEKKSTVFKFAKPFKVYMKWTEGSDSGQEVIFNPEKYGHKLQAHAGGWLNVVNVSLDPRGSQAMKSSRHSIYEAGVGTILDLVKKNYQRSKALSKGKVTFLKEEQFDNRNSYLFMAEFPPDAGFYAKKIWVNLDEKTKLPVKISIYGFKDEFLEFYSFRNLKINSGLTELDFDKDNPSYKF